MALFIHSMIKNNFAIGASAITDPSFRAERREIEQLNDSIQMLAKLDMTLGNLFSMAAVISLTAQPILLAVAATFKVAITILEHEIVILTKNENKLLSDTGPLGNITTKWHVFEKTRYIAFMQNGLWFPEMLDSLKNA